MSAAGVTVSTAPTLGAGPGSTPRAALHTIHVRPIPIRAAKALLVPHHYLHSLPGGTKLAFGVFVESALLGAMTLGVGPYNATPLWKAPRRTITSLSAACGSPTTCPGTPSPGSWGLSFGH